MTKKLMVLLLAIMVGSLFAETAETKTQKRSVLRIHFNDGSYRDYPVERVSQLNFDADPNDPIEPDPKFEPDIEVPGDRIGSSSGMSATLSSSQVESKSSASKTDEKSSASKTSLAVAQKSFGNAARWNAGSKVLSLESSENTKAEVYVFGPQGICLAKKKVLLIPGYNSVYFDNVDLARSVYIVRVKTATKDAILKIQDMK